MKQKFDIHQHKVLLFDLGGVILNLSFLKTYNAFAKLSNKSVYEIEECLNSVSVFKEFEIGVISEHEFRLTVNKILQTDLPYEVLDESWNAMLGDLPLSRLKVLEKLKNTHTLILFSNTNSIHLRAFTTIVNQISLYPLDYFFNTVYYSHIVGLRKPDNETFKWICKQQNIQPSTFLFFDDSLVNIHGAKEVGMNAYHVKDADELFKELERQI